jgi:arylsulfatase A-like enzyme
MLMTSRLTKNVIRDDKLIEAFGNREIPGRRTAAEINGAFLAWLERKKAGAPFFAFLNYFDAHDPYLPPPEFAQKFTRKKPSGLKPMDAFDQLTAEDIADLNNDYDASIAYIDHQIGSLISELSRQGILENTLILITADHGEQFGEHNLLEHGNSLYLPLLQVPFVLTYPGRIPAGRRLSRPVSLMNIAATILDLAGLSDRSDIPGLSMSRFFSSEPGSQDRENSPIYSMVDQGHQYPAWYPSMKGSMKSIIRDNKHFIKNYGDGREELYDLDTDPEEVNDLASSGGYQDEISSFRSLLDNPD